MKGPVVVTGSSGVAGSALRALAPKHADRPLVFLTSRDWDLTRPEEAAACIRRHRPSGILHLAAVSGGIGLSARHHASMLRDNVLMAFNILEAARACDVGKVVMTLTAGGYPLDAPQPFKEESLQDGWPAENNYGSSFAKRLIEPAVRAWREEYGLHAVGLIPGGIFGENDNFNLEDAPMLPALIRRFHEARGHDGPVEIWGDGTPRREYTYSRDIARIFLWALDHYDEPGCLNIGSTEEHTVAEIAGMIADLMGVDRTRIRFDPSRPGGVPSRSTDNGRFLALSGFEYTPFRVGLERTVAWYLETAERHPERLRTYAKGRGLAGAVR